MTPMTHGPAGPDSPDARTQPAGSPPSPFALRPRGGAEGSRGGDARHPEGVAHVPFPCR